MFLAFFRPRAVDWAVLLLCREERAVCRPRLTAWVAFAATDGFSLDDGSTERVGGGVETFSGTSVIFTSRSVLAKMCLPVLGSMTSHGVAPKEDGAVRGA